MIEINKIDEVNGILKKLSNFLESECSSEKYNSFEFKEKFDFDFVMIKAFHNIAQTISISNGEEKYLFQILEPSPIEYFYKKYKSFCSFVFEQDDDGDTFLQMLNGELGDLYSDSPDIIADEICVCDFRFNWFIFANRKEGLTYFLTNDQNLHKESMRILMTAPYFN